MDCFLTAFRVYTSKKFSRDGYSESEDATSGFLKNSILHSSSDSSTRIENGHGASSCLRRHRAAAFLMRFYVSCGVKTSASYVTATDGNAEILFEMGLQSEEEEKISRETKEVRDVLQWWEESGGEKRRKLGSGEWVASGSHGNLGNLLGRAPARFKKLMRRIKAKMRKMGQVQNAISFQYDPLSYSMNFDEGCWRHCEEVHRKLFRTLALAADCNSPQQNCKVPKR